MSKTTDFRSLVVAADPEWTRERRFVTEYEFQAKGGGDPRTHENGQRVFKGYYDRRGAYAED